jgi:predicted phage terminase large subunit-like protein
VKWSVVYKGAYNDDGSLFFPEKLSQEFLDNAKKTMGSYLFSNQYLNEIIPSELQTFRKEWLRYYKYIPEKHTTFITIDPALSEADTSDYTGVVVCHVDYEKRWYVSYAQRHRVSPTRLVDLIFSLNQQFKPNAIGIEEVSYQKALLYFLDEEMRRRDVLLPVSGIRPPNQKTKQMRILSLVPRFEWGHIYLSQGLQDLELELLRFPRGAHDDLIDSLAYIDYIAYAPDKEREFEKQPGPQHPDYERWYIQQLRKKRKSEDE